VSSCIPQHSLRQQKQVRDKEFAKFTGTRVTIASVNFRVSSSHESMKLVLIVGFDTVSMSTTRPRLPNDVNRILFVRNLPFKIKNDELYDIFGKYGPIRQIRLGNATSTRGSAFVVYEDIRDAKAAHDQLSGFSVAGRYLVCVYYKYSKMQERFAAKREGAQPKEE
jgi:pre-mRNA branch site protein p14